MEMSHYLSRVLPSVDGCPSPIAERAVRDAIDDLCRDSRVFRESQSVPMVAGTDTYTITANTANSVLSEVIFSRIGDGVLEPITPENRNRLVSGSGKPEYIEQLTNTDFRLTPAPLDTTPLDVTVVLTITDTATTIPDIFDRWKEGIASGALSKLMVMPNKPWSNPSLATFHAQIFNQAIGSASAFAVLGNRKAQLRVQAHP